MPKISIREIDRTGSEKLSYNDYTVLVPGALFAIKNNPESGEEIEVDADNNLDGLYTSLEQFDGKISDIIANAKDPDTQKFLKGLAGFDFGVTEARELLKVGLTVQYANAYDVGADGSITLTFNDAWEDFYKKFTDKGIYDLRFITLGGFDAFDSDWKEKFTEPDKLVNGLKVAALKCAAFRGDAIALLNVGHDIRSTDEIENWLVADGASGLQAAAQSIVTRKGTSGPDWNRNETMGRYGALFAPSIAFKIFKYQSNQATPIELPASFGYLLAFAKSIQSFSCWKAVAGSVRGVLPYVVTPDYAYGDADIDVLQARDGGEFNNGKYQYNGHVATNVICNIRPYGDIIWGSRTMQPLSKPENDDGDAAIQLTASSFLNVRQLCCTLKKRLYRTSRKYTFEANSDELWFKFRNDITTLLDEMKADYGIRSYKISKQRTNKKGLFVAVVNITPIEAVEDFDLTVEMSDADESIEVRE